MLWRMSADTHEQWIGIMSTTPAFFAHLEPTTSVSGSVSATKVLPRGLRPPAMAKWVAETAGMGAEPRMMLRSQPGKAAGSARLGSAAQAATKASWTTSSAR